MRHSKSNMKKVILSFCLFFLFAAINISRGQQIILDPQVRTGKLPNGQTYYIRNNRIPKERADFYLVQKVGSVLEDENQRGLAHFLEHMAFNGSKHFPGNSLITELEKKGIRFGSNINASTSYDETIYKLINIPLNREGIIDTSLLVLHDWAGFLTLNDKDIDDERGVVREEWRLSSGGDLRVLQNEIFPVIYAGTPYANRIPIGSIDVVNNFKYQELRDYYKKWYRPDLQGIIVVGDIDVDKIEKKIKRLFADIPVPIKPAERVYSLIPDNAKPIIAYGIDKEITATTLAAYWKMEEWPMAQKSALAWYKMNLINQTIASLLINRFNEVREKTNAPFSSASIYSSTFVFASLKPAWNLTVYPKEKNEVLKAFNGAFTEIERMHQFGFTAAELEDFKKGTLTGLEKQYTDRANKITSIYINEYTKHFLTNEPAPGAEWEYNMGKKLLSELTIDTINYYAKKSMGDSNLVIYAMTPKDDNHLPAKEDIIRIWNESKNVKLEPYVYETASTQLLEKKPIPGKIVKTESKPFGFTCWTLSNGAKVWFKKIDYKEDKLNISAYSPGGYSQASDQNLPSAKLTGMSFYGGFGNLSMSELNKVLIGKDAWILPSVTEFSESLEGEGSIKDKETLFQLTYLRMAIPPRKDQQYFDTWKKSSLEAFNNRYAEPSFVFRDTVAGIMSNHHPRAISAERDSSIINKVDYDKVLRMYQERFANARDFTFIITGNLPVDSIRPLVETYLGGLPSVNSYEKVKDYGIYPPKGMIRKQFTHSMVTPKSSVHVAYTGDNIPYTLENEVMMSFVGRILTINYTENLREKEGGVYYVGAAGSISKFPKDNFNFSIWFATDPDPIKKAKLMKIMYAEIDKLIEQGPAPENVDKAKGNLLKSVREWAAEKNANYWNYTASQYVIYGIDRHNNYEKFVSSVTPEMIRDFAKKIFTQGNLIDIEMDPEKK
ncbi:zinc protease [Chitinophaga sp. CF118]|uniref:M16 family metallopeptidase n=1 Tax=Chitinophaga sp. CF118 TaxID=1884367 RepID=UPI0008E0E555|nr:M16 family metallopeptidase [Chitinophaga sp. CF118]SFD01058.1 zinc protease [Chitinophaga sp. CF118]